MNYGFSMAAAGVGDARTLGELAAMAEGVGWDGFFVEDYIIHWHAPDALTYDPWIALAAVAFKTQHMRLGISVTPLPRRRPWKVAREAATLDHLSGGRMILGVGIGDGQSQDFAKFHEEGVARVRASMLDEALEIIVGLWTGEPFSYSGQHYQVEEVRLRPPPVQSPRIPVWIGGGWPLPGPAQRAARWDGSCLYRHTASGPWQDLTPEDVAGIRAGARAHHGRHKPYDIAVGGRERGPDWEAERAHIHSVAQAGATWWIEHIDPTTLEATRNAILRGPLRVAMG